MPYGREQMSAMAADLCGRGFAVWNIEYRRVGEAGVGWDEVSADVVASLEFLRGFSEREHALDLDHVALAGHSAGGQLALACTSSRARGLSLKPAAIVALAAITDLDEAFASDLGNGAVGALLGGAPSDHPARYADASPVQLLPHGSRLLVLHGTIDEDVPIAQSRSYVRAAVSAGDDVAYLELEGTDHMDFLDPQSSAHARLCDWLQG